MRAELTRPQPLREGARVRTMVGLMRTALFAALVLSLSGCSLYSGDDDGAGDVDGGHLPMAGNYIATWSCNGSPCANPLEDDTIVSVGEYGDEVRVSWAFEGSLAPTSLHVGAHSTAECARFPAGADRGIERSGYALCVSPDEAGVLIGTMAWSSSTWSVDLTRY